MAKTQAKRLVVCVDNERHQASLEKRKICVALRDSAAEKHGLVRGGGAPTDPLRRLTERID